MKKIFQNKSLLKSIQVFLVCLVVLGGGILGNNEAEADCSIAGSSPYTDIMLGDFSLRYSYARTNAIVSVEYQGGDGYKIVDDDVTVLYRSVSADCTTEICGFFTLLKENNFPYDYYFLIGEDDFMPGGSLISPPNCTEVCQAFENDFIPIISENLIGGTIDPLMPPQRIGGAFFGHSIITADNGTDKIHFIFSDYMISAAADGYLDIKGWDTIEHVGGSGFLSTSLDICNIVSSPTSPPPPPPSTECKPGLVPCGRICDVDSTPYHENDPCTLCHLILMAQLIMDFLFKIAAVAAAFFISVAGYYYIFAGGQSEKIALAKKTFTGALIGFLIILISWIAVDSTLVMFGYIDPLENDEWHVMCGGDSPAPPPPVAICGDGVRQTPNSAGFNEECDLPDNPCASGVCLFGCVCQEELKVIGDVCDAFDECETGFCANGVCCDSACDTDVCQRCDAYSASGAGHCDYVNSSLEDPDDECATATSPNADSCKSDFCSGAGYSCGYLSVGEQGQPACKECLGSSYDPVDITDDTQDDWGSNLCNQVCKKCSGGSCVNQDNEDLFSQCSGGEICDSGSCSCWDNDGDGHTDTACGGDDCNDSDSDMYPGHSGHGYTDGKDNNCNGNVDECSGSTCTSYGYDTWYRGGGGEIDLSYCVGAPECGDWDSPWCQATCPCPAGGVYCTTMAGQCTECVYCTSCCRSSTCTAWN